MLGGTVSVLQCKQLFLQTNFLSNNFFVKLPRSCRSGSHSKHAWVAEALSNWEELTCQHMALTRNRHGCNDMLRSIHVDIYIYTHIHIYTDICPCKIDNNKCILFCPLGDNVSYWSLISRLCVLQDRNCFQLFSGSRHYK